MSPPLCTGSSLFPLTQTILKSLSQPRPRSYASLLGRRIREELILGKRNYDRVRNREHLDGEELACGRRPVLVLVNQQGVVAARGIVSRDGKGSNKMKRRLLHQISQHLLRIECQRLVRNRDETYAIVTDRAVQLFPAVYQFHAAKSAGDAVGEESFAQHDELPFGIVGTHEEDEISGQPAIVENHPRPAEPNDLVCRGRVTGDDRPLVGPGAMNREPQYRDQ